MLLVHKDGQRPVSTQIATAVPYHSNGSAGEICP